MLKKVGGQFENDAQRDDTQPIVYSARLIGGKSVLVFADFDGTTSGAAFSHH